jgi:AraC-like DNA-binding protein
MQIHRPLGIHGGFHAMTPDAEVPELTHAGESWWPTNRRIRAHEHPVWELYLQIDGTSHWGIPGQKTRKLTPGTFLAVPPRLTHEMTEMPSVTHHFFFAGVDLATVHARQPALAAVWPAAGWVVIDGADGLRDPFRQLLNEVRADQPLRADGLRLALDYLLIMVARQLGQRRCRLFPICHPAVETARRLLTAHPERPWPLIALAHAVRLSPNHLASLFHREVGTTPHRFLLARRIERAQEMLADSDLDVVEIAQRLGFSSRQHLARIFRAHIGHNPCQWRRQR